MEVVNIVAVVVVVAVVVIVAVVVAVFVTELVKVEVIVVTTVVGEGPMVKVLPTKASTTNDERLSAARTVVRLNKRNPEPVAEKGQISLENLSCPLTLFLGQLY